MEVQKQVRDSTTLAKLKSQLFQTGELKRSNEQMKRKTNEHQNGGSKYLPSRRGNTHA